LAANAELNTDIKSSLGIPAGKENLTITDESKKVNFVNSSTASLSESSPSKPYAPYA